MRSLFLVLLCGCFYLSDLPAQASQAVAIQEYIDTYNANHSVRDWIDVERAPVTLSVNEDNELVATLDNDRKLRISLQRETADEMDGLFPLKLDQAMVVFAGETILIFDHINETYFALTIAEDPRLPRLTNEQALIFRGYGLAQHWSSATKTGDF